MKHLLVNIDAKILVLDYYFFLIFYFILDACPIPFRIPARLVATQLFVLFGGMRFT